MPNKMLIDASHPEETRVVVTRGNRIEEFDFESQDKKQLKGNIYLARVTRVEPSLQAAFVEYGGNRHGFLAFSEIHPDYYQIPVADRQALLRAEAEEAAEDDEDDEDERGKGRRRKRNGRGRDRKEQEASGSHAAGEAAGEAASEPHDEAGLTPGEASADAEAEAEETSTPAAKAAATESESISEAVPAATASEDEAADHGGDSDDHTSVAEEPEEIESVGAEDALEELPSRRKVFRKQYKIQEVIKRRQILLVQVVKEERGNKGAALTTYLSLAGRYSVLMPNTARGGGISRKITSAPDRKRLKDVVKELEVPQGMGVILRTAGANRTKPEIKRDYEYLMRLWENVRTLTLQSTAPALVYEEGSLIKRSVRDLYNKDIDEILVAGEEGYREAKDFMRMLMPSHAKVVQPYRDVVPIFARQGIEAQLDRMLQPQVTLKSGGYIIINQTEALVSIDVNSGRSTREHSIEDTALQTNLEAAEEVARQLRLRDMAGLIVIDFIDMEEKRNNRSVEKRLKEHLKNDRARIQVGRISHFGLLEMSRQRIRASVLESTMKPCPHCGGTGHVRSDSSVALHVVRAIEEFLLKDSRCHITVRTPVATALYVLNHKRRNIGELEERFALEITIEADDTLGTQHYAISRGAVVERPADYQPPSQVAPVAEPDEEIDIVEIDDEVEDDTPEAASEHQDEAARDQDGQDDGRRRKRRRRRRRGGRDRDQQDGVSAGSGDDGDDASAEADGDHGDDEVDEVGGDAAAQDDVAAAEEDGERKKRRRGKRGGRKGRRDEDGETPAEAAQDADADVAAEAHVSDADDVTTEVVADVATEIVAETSAPAAVEHVETETVAVEVAAEPAAPAEVAAEPEAPAKPKRVRRSRAKAAAEPVASDVVAAEAEPEAPAAEPAAKEPVVAEAAAPIAAPETASAPADDQPAEPEASSGDDVTVNGEAPRDSRARRRTDAAEVASEPVVTSTAATEGDGEPKPRKAGWWQRKSFF